MLAEADIRVGGDRPWDIRVHNEGLYKRVLREGTLGAGEAYLEGWWDCDQLDVMFCKALHAHLEDKVRRNLPNALIVASQLLFNLQSVARAPMVAEQHYNTDNAMFARMLGPTMNYSCGYWKDAETLDEAQRNKMDLICRKLDLKEGMSVLDIGCGWGGLSLYMAKEYGVKRSPGSRFPRNSWPMPGNTMPGISSTGCCRITVPWKGSSIASSPWGCSSTWDGKITIFS